MASRTLDDLGGEKQLQQPRQQLQDSTGISRQATGNTTKVFSQAPSSHPEGAPRPNNQLPTRRGSVISVGEESGIRLTPAEPPKRDIPPRLARQPQTGEGTLTTREMGTWAIGCAVTGADTYQMITGDRRHSQPSQAHKMPNYPDPGYTPGTISKTALPGGARPDTFLAHKPTSITTVPQLRLKINFMK